MHRRVLVLAAVLLVSVGSLPVAGTPTTTPDGTQGDGLGREDGYAANDTIDVDRSDGLDEAELQALVSRTMARVETIRDLEFRRDVPVEVVNRSTFQQRERNRTIEPSRRTFDNAKFEALFLVNETTDSVAVQRNNSGAAVQGYYSIERDAIVLVSDDDEAVRIGEFTLAHELVHALQDQHFNLSRYDARTRDGRHGQDGLIEGDAGFVEHRYRSLCEERWSGTCRPADGSVDGDLANFGVYTLSYFPYSDGPPFVSSLHATGGWEAVDAAYDDPPVSAEQVIHPTRYPAETPVSLAYETPSTGTATESPTAVPTPGTDETTTSTPAGPSTATGSPNASSSPTVTTTSPASLGTPTPSATASTTTGTDGTATTAPGEDTTPASAGANASAANATVTATSGFEGTPPSDTPTPPGTATANTTATIPTNTTPVTPTGLARTTTVEAEHWELVRPEGRPNHGSVGEAAIAAMFFYPTYLSGGETSIVSGEAFFNRSGRELSSFDPFEYDQPVSDGWNGDRLRVYRNGANETGYIWQLAWESPAEAREFASGYRALLSYYGAEPAGQNTYRIHEGGFADAFYVQVSDTRVTIVNGPSLADLLPIYANVGDVDGANRPQNPATDRTTANTPIAPTQPGFGPLAALAGIVLALLLGLRRST